MARPKLKGLVIAGSYDIYRYWSRKYDKNPDEYQYVSNRHQIRGYYKLRSPDLEVILLHEYWKNPVYNTDDFRLLEGEFDVKCVSAF